MPIEDLLSDDDRRQLEALRLIALARDLLTDDHQQHIKMKLGSALDELERFRGGLTTQPPPAGSAVD